MNTSHHSHQTHPTHTSHVSQTHFVDKHVTCVTCVWCVTGACCLDVQSPPSTRKSSVALVVCGAGQRSPRRRLRAFRPAIRPEGHTTSCPVRSARFPNESLRSEVLRANRWDSRADFLARTENPSALLHPVAFGRNRRARNLRPLESARILYRNF
jgi:hypothetical protein